MGEIEYDMKPLTSGNLKAVGYDTETRTLRVEFAKSGATYEYYGVPEEIFSGILNAPSAGAYFDMMVKKAGYGYSPVS